MNNIASDVMNARWMLRKRDLAVKDVFLSNCHGKPTLIALVHTNVETMEDAYDALTEMELTIPFEVRCSRPRSSVGRAPA